MKVKIKKLHPNAIIPKYSKIGDAGLDLTAVSKEYYTILGEKTIDSIKSLEDLSESIGYIEYAIGLSIEIPEGYVGLVFPRSSISNKHLLLCNSVGVIDSGYRGEIKCRFTWPNLTDAQCPSNPIFYAQESIEEYNVGDRVAQLIIIPYPSVELEEVEELSSSERGETGFGSTNKVQPHYNDGYLGKDGSLINFKPDIDEELILGDTIRNGDVKLIYRGDNNFQLFTNNPNDFITPYHLTLKYTKF